jgi:ATP-dependent protease HslVU (ClpYQ) peptidase subunit
MELRGTTIIGVKKNGKTIIAGDGQATLGEHVIMKSNSKKVRRIFNDKVVIGFAGSVADAFAFCGIAKHETRLPGFLWRQKPKAEKYLAHRQRGSHLDTDRQHKNSAIDPKS